MLDYAAKLSLEPWNMDESDVQQLRDAGFSNTGILDIVHAVSYTHLTLPTIYSV